MIPLNIYLQEALDAGPGRPARAPADGAQRHRIRQRHQGPGGRQHLPRRHAVEELRRHAHGKVVFYDYDEIEYLTDCNFRRVPAPRNEEDEMSGEVWYTVGPRDVFPETFGPFLLGNDAVRECSCSTTRPAGRRLLAEHKERIQAGHVHDVFPYDPERRFVHTPAH
jgi:isocitrate dehydrogenase kinase/phosphatase